MVELIGIKKAQQSPCRYKISAIGLNKKDEIIIKSMCKPRFSRKGGGVHAEMEVMLKGGKAVKKILLFRTNLSGDLLPIEPCETCRTKAMELGVKIIPIF